mmetsp:Transcript_67846/g.133463  ORF Transcript_67846/g.133463 Transcript_67846/m.133463 type:complete len:228 (+) Transcript_67846:122-805(+)
MRRDEGDRHDCTCIHKLQIHIEPNQPCRGTQVIPQSLKLAPITYNMKNRGEYLLPGVKCRALPSSYMLHEVISTERLQRARYLPQHSVHVIHRTQHVCPDYIIKGSRININVFAFQPHSAHWESDVACLALSGKLLLEKRVRFNSHPLRNGGIILPTTKISSWARANLKNTSTEISNIGTSQIIHWIGVNRTPLYDLVKRVVSNVFICCEYSKKDSHNNNDQIEQGR